MTVLGSFLFTGALFAQQLVSTTEEIFTAELTKDVSLVGGWANVGGGSDMETGIGDRVPVRCSTNIYIEGDKVMLKVFYHIEEYGGDHTVFSGSRTYVLYQNSDPSFRLRTIEIDGPRLNNFQTFTMGESHHFIDFSTANSYWERLQFCVDGPGPHDDEAVGIKGRVNLKVILQRTPDPAKDFRPL